MHLDRSNKAAEDRTKQGTNMGWTMGFTAFFACGTLAAEPTWPAAFGVAAVSAMVAVVCCAVLKKVY